MEVLVDDAEKRKLSACHVHQAMESPPPQGFGRKEWMARLR